MGSSSRVDARPHPDDPKFVIVDSAFGELRIVWSTTAAGPRLRYVSLPGEQSRATDGLARGSCAVIDDLSAQMHRYLSGEAANFSLGVVDMEQCGDFQQRVLVAEHAIPRGQVSTYGRVAGAIGRPGAARAVGQALGRNPYPIIIPCHRAVRSDGSLGGYRGGVAMKRELLRLEGVMVDGKGKVVVDQFYY